MGARAVSVEETRDRVLDAALVRYRLPYDRIRLDDVAADAGVTVQTVIRRFGGKAGLVVALVQREAERIGAARAAASGGSVAALVHELVAHYERYGDLILKMYAEAPLVAGLPAVAARARAFHMEWCRSAFAEHLREDDPARSRHIVEVVAVCDATTWRILRRDGGLDPAEVEAALCELLRAPLGDRP